MNNNTKDVFRKIITKVDYFSSPLAHTEAAIIKNAYQEFNVKVVYFRNNSIEQLLDGLYQKEYQLGDGILIGNSADLTNNHLDVFNTLNKHKCLDRKIIVPLSYSGNSNYKRKVIAKGKSIFRSNFVPIEEFMDKSTYNRSVLLECRTIIFFHERQQAMANILTALWVGAKVFLSETGIVYKEFKANGFAVYSFQESSPNEIRKELSTDEKLINQELLLKYYGYNTSLNRIKNLVLELERDV